MNHPARHVLHVTRVHEKHLEAARFEDLEDRDPIGSTSMASCAEALVRRARDVLEALGSEAFAETAKARVGAALSANMS